MVTMSNYNILGNIAAGYVGCKLCDDVIRITDLGIIYDYDLGDCSIDAYVSMFECSCDHSPLKNAVQDRLLSNKRGDPAARRAEYDVRFLACVGMIDCPEGMTMPPDAAPHEVEV